VFYLAQTEELLVSNQVVTTGREPTPATPPRIACRGPFRDRHAPHVNHHPQFAVVVGSIGSRAALLAANGTDVRHSRMLNGRALGTLPATGLDVAMTETAPFA
jgi:hypothetical protein